MRREKRRHEEVSNKKNILYIGGSILGIGIILFAITFVVYGNNIEEDIGAERIATLVQESSDNAETISTQFGKTVDEAKNEIIEQNNNTVSSNIQNTTTNTKKENNTIATNSQSTKSNTSKENTVTTNSVKKDTENDSKKEQMNMLTSTNDDNNVLTFIKPVEGEIMKDYAKDSLTYSNTLQEWTTHLGVDIKANKTTVVKAVADGKVKSIKNDPRYGLSVIIEHQDGYETLYANLLTAEFVNVGEEVKQGATIGTVGDTATFEIADDPHLHFEISKNGENLDPNGYIK